MRAAGNQALIDFLASGRQFLMADLYEFALLDGSFLRYTTADIPLTLNGAVYVANEVRLERSQVSITRGLQVDNLEITCHAGPDDLINGVLFPLALLRGALDGAYLTLHRVFMPTWGDTSLGGIILFGGKVADIEPALPDIKIIVKAMTEYLNRQMPPLLYQAPCQHTLYGASCGVVKDDYAVNGTVAGGIIDESHFFTDLSQGDDYFTLGTVRFTSGALSGTIRTVRASAQVNGLITVFPPLLSAPAPGDAFMMYPGCDRTLATCAAKFNNRLHFGGQPFIPVPETTQ